MFVRLLLPHTWFKRVLCLCVVDCCLCSGLLVFVFGLVVCGFLVIDMYTHVCLFLFFLSVFDMLCLICVLLFVCFWRVCVCLSFK